MIIKICLLQSKVVQATDMPSLLSIDAKQKKKGYENIVHRITFLKSHKMTAVYSSPFFLWKSCPTGTSNLMFSYPEPETLGQVKTKPSLGKGNKFCCVTIHVKSYFNML